MKIWLNTEKSSFLMIGNVAFTVHDPGPLDVDYDACTEELKKQIRFNCNIGVLEYEGEFKTEQLPEPEVVPAPTPVIPHNTNPLEGFEHAIDKQLKKLLRQKIPSIKKELPRLSPGNLKKLLELERNGKNRKKIMALLSELLKSHEEQVLNKINAEVTKAESLYFQGIKGIGSPNVTDIVESEEEEITLVQTPSEE